MNKGLLTHGKTSRRQFVRLAGGLALALRHGLVPAQSAIDAAPPEPRGVAALEDSVLCIEWDAKLHARISRTAGRQRVAMTSWGPSEYLLDVNGRHIADFAFGHQARINIADANGPGTRLTLSGTSADGVEKTVQATLYQRHPGIALMRVSYRNAAAGILSIRSWSNGDSRLLASGTRASEFWCYSGASYEDRRDWVQPVEPGFAQDNFLGMEASDYGGGTPIVDVWRRDGGLAVGHVEITPKRVSLPVQGERRTVRVAVCGREKRNLKPGETFETPETFVSVHDGDYFSVLSRYRVLMSERGMTPAVPPAASYEPVWCAWGYERDCTTALIEATLPKVKELGLEWAVIDDGWQAMIGDWNPHRAKYPNGEADLRRLVSNIRAGGLKPRLWYSPLSAAPGSDFLHDHADMLLLDKDGAVQNITWWNSFYLCPAYQPTVQYTQALIKKFIGEWGFAGLKIDGQHLNNVAPCFNPAHHHERPEESVEGLQWFFRAIYQTATAIDPDAVMELCPCGTAYSAFNFPYMNQAPASDPESSWQVRHKGKTLKALMGPSAPYAGDHVELSDRHDDFASTVGVGAVVSTKFTWPIDPKPKDSFLLTPEKEGVWRRWIALYKDKMLPLGTYRGELYDIGFDRPETHAIEKDGRLYYAFFADRWRGPVALRGLHTGAYQIRDYFNDRELATVSGASARLTVTFERFLLLEAIPA
ncbi:MAG TPA: glycoside hydrolase family 36 protein [Steroidobacteraceae bacterium]|nr:glycoside hydrolase family 36 protein [Steroidobacteraceae bacterium]